MPKIKDFLLTKLYPKLRKRLEEAKADLLKKRPVRAVHNLQQGLRHCSPAEIVNAIVARYPCCYVINVDHRDFPFIDFVKYRALSPAGDAPLVRVDERVLMDLEAHRVDSLPNFKDDGATLVRGAGCLPLPGGAAIVATIATTGWHIMTVDDAHRILAGRDCAGPEGGFLKNGNGWTSNVQDMADRLKIVSSLFPICERIVATRVAAMVIYLPCLPSPFRLWRRSLKKVMPPLPPRA